MVPFESLRTVSYSHSIATMAVSLAVSTQYTNVTDTDTTAQIALMDRIAQQPYWHILSHQGILSGQHRSVLARPILKEPYDTIRYDTAYLTCSKKLTDSQLSLPHGTNKNVKEKPVQSHHHEGSPMSKEEKLRWEGFVEKVGFEPRVKE